MQNVTLNVHGMACGSCVKTIGNSIHKIEGIKAVDVNVAEGLVTVEYNDSLATIKQIIKLIELHGYEVVDTIYK